MAKEPVEELRLAGMLIEAAGGKVDWTAYPDQAAQELKGLIEAKLAGQAPVVSAPAPTILSLLEALKKSVGTQNGKVATRGSHEYTLTWKRQVIVSGLAIFRLRASARPTSGNDSSSWPTTAGWATPNAADSKSHRNETATRHVEPPTGIHPGQTLTDQVDGLTGTSTSRGLNRGSSSAGTASAVAYLLNPRFSLWLQGYPAAWASCAERAIASCRRSRRRSSEHT
jgi:hypothetical protein